MEGVPEPSMRDRGWVAWERPRGPWGVGGRVGVGCVVSGVRVLGVDAKGLVRLLGWMRGAINGGGRRSSL